MQDEAREFNQRLQELHAHHIHILNEMDRENRLQVEELNREAQHLQQEAKVLKEVNLKSR